MQKGDVKKIKYQLGEIAQLKTKNQYSQLEFYKLYDRLCKELIFISWEIKGLGSVS